MFETETIHHLSHELGTIHNFLQVKRCTNFLYVQCMLGLLMYGKTYRGVMTTMSIYFLLFLSIISGVLYCYVNVRIFVIRLLTLTRSTNLPRYFCL